MIESIQKAVSIPVIKVRIGHFMEARILEAMEVDFIDESEVLTPADEAFHIDKHAFSIPFVCGCTDLGEALRRIGEGAALLRTKGEAGTGNIVEGVRHLRTVHGHIRKLTRMNREELMTEAKNLGAPYDLVCWVAENGRLPVPNFAAGGIATPADAALCMALGAETILWGQFMANPERERERSSKQPLIGNLLRNWSRSARSRECPEQEKLSAAERLSTRGW